MTDHIHSFDLKRDYASLFEVMTTNNHPKLSQTQQVEGFAVLLRLVAQMKKEDQQRLIHAVRTGNGEVFEELVLAYAPSEGSVTALPRTGMV